MNGIIKTGLSGIKVGFRSVDFVCHKINQGKDWFLNKIAVKFPKWITANRLSWLRIYLTITIIITLANFQFIGSLVKWLFIVSIVTDLFDGPIARSRRQITEKGAFLDRLGDKLLVCPLIVVGLWPYDKPLVVAIAGSEIISLAIGLAALRRYVPSQSNWLGKWKMGFQSAGLMVIMFFPSETHIATKVLWAAVALGLASLRAHIQAYVVHMPKQKDG